MTDEPVIDIMRLNPNRDRDIQLPRYMTPGAAGMDIYAAVDTSVELPPGGIALVSTGFAMALPRGYEAQIRPRSGLAVKHGIGLINSPGTIDADYRGEIMLGLINHGPKPYTIHRGDRVAQMIISQVVQPEIQEVDSLDDTQRQDGGFGHTGR